MVSVIIPCYNSATTIKRALESVTSQTYTSYEIIIIDDGSLDNTKDQAESFLQAQLVNYKYVYQENKGPSVARNNGVAYAQGDFIAFLDADDSWHPQKLEIQMKVIEEKGLNFLGSTYQYNDFTEAITNEIKIEKYSFQSLLFKTRFSTPGVIISTNFFKMLGIFDTSLNYSEDNDLWLRAALENELYLIVEPKLVRLYKSIYGESGLSSKMFDMFLGERYILKKLYCQKHISLLNYFGLSVYYFLKFVRRYMFTIVKKFLKKRKFYE